MVLSDPLAETPTVTATSPPLEPLPLEDPPPDDLPPPNLLNDPPPPYPNRERRRTVNRRRRPTASHHQQFSSADSDNEGNAHSLTSLPPQPFPSSADALSETTPLLASSTGSPGSARRLTGTFGRPRSVSHTSTLISSTSATPSLSHTVFSLFRHEQDEDSDIDFVEAPPDEQPTSAQCLPEIRRRQWALFSRRAWKKYFRVVGQRAYWAALFHLLILNFPFALLAWVYLFVFTLTGTTLLMALPLGAVLCFFNLLGARAFSRGELALQSTFHSPLAYPPPYPPRPIFTRMRAPTSAEVEAGMVSSTMYESSFYKNAYAMFTDSTSYQALFYFLVIKPSITIILTFLLLLFVPVSIALILPFPAVLRAARKLGQWQAGVAIEGLYLAVS